jgi:hypothetical protein
MISLDKQITECETIVVKRNMFQTESVIMTVANTDYKMSYHVSINIVADTKHKKLANTWNTNVQIVLTSPHPNLVTKTKCVSQKIFTHIIKKYAMVVNMIFTIWWVQEQIAGWSQGTGAEPGSTYGTLGSAKTTPGTHVLDPTQNTIKMCIIKKCT